MFWVLMILGVLFGVFNKLANLSNEHGLRWFRGSAVLFGIGWGLSGGLLSVLNEHLAVLLMSLTLFWLIELKLDYRNHALAGAIIVLSCAWKIQRNPQFDWNLIVFVMSCYLLTGLAHRILKQSVPHIVPFLRLRLRYYLIPGVLSIITRDIAPFTVILVDMLAVELVTYIAKRNLPSADSYS